MPWQCQIPCMASRIMASWLFCLLNYLVQPGEDHNPWRTTSENITTSCILGLPKGVGATHRPRQRWLVIGFHFRKMLPSIFQPAGLSLALPFPGTFRPLLASKMCRTSQTSFLVSGGAFDLGMTQKGMSMYFSVPALHFVVGLWADSTACNKHQHTSL